ncbi:hypothetical protein LTR56_021453 [Elasticomyces elasticus]|nr:hypothetical protein LTR56_021453 [Elasticomyces elasticus]KAK4912170.1 hypothetical protein LTR49_019358 [Elasticomyces elasticus]KAK5747672.1 hypothetical protein LTS12_022272 [Elasticomyces elasticus]
MPIRQGFLGQSSDDSNHNPDNKDDNNNNNDNNNDNPQAQPATSLPRVVTLGDMTRQAEDNMAFPRRARDRGEVIWDIAELSARVTALERTVTVLERDRVERERRPRTPVRDEMLDDDARISPIGRRSAEREGMLQTMRSRAIEAGEFEDYATVSEDERLRQYDRVRRQGYGMFGRSDVPYVMSEERRNERGAVSGALRDRQMIEERMLVDGDGDLGAQERRTNERIVAYEEYRRRALELGVDVMSEESFNGYRGL